MHRALIHIPRSVCGRSDRGGGETSASARGGRAGRQMAGEGRMPAVNSMASPTMARPPPTARSIGRPGRSSAASGGRWDCPRPACQGASSSNGQGWSTLASLSDLQGPPQKVKIPLRSPILPHPPWQKLRCREARDQSEGALTIISPGIACNQPDAPNKTKLSLILPFVHPFFPHPLPFIAPSAASQRRAGPVTMLRPLFFLLSQSLLFGIVSCNVGLHGADDLFHFVTVSPQSNPLQPTRRHRRPVSSAASLSRPPRRATADG
jgi:hypothetical protein